MKLRLLLTLLTILSATVLVMSGCASSGGGNSGNDTGNPECGNNEKEAGEQCDGIDLGGLKCNDVVPGTTGLLKCTAACTFDTSSCSSTSGVQCGNNRKEAGEQCDGADLGETQCSDVIPGSTGTLTCNSDCTLNSSQCHINGQSSCGNGQVDSGEQCDGNNLNGATCQSQGYDAGTLSCKSDCTFDTSQCTNNGNYNHEVWEDCDPNATDPNSECAPHNGKSSACIPREKGGICLQSCTAKSDCGFSLDCLSFQNNGNFCYYDVCGPNGNGGALNSACQFSDNATGWCYPVLRAMDGIGICLENGQVSAGGQCNANADLGDIVNLSQQCNAGTCYDSDGNGTGECVAFCDPIAVYGSGNDTCPSGYNCLNLSSLITDQTDPDYLFREPDFGLCWPDNATTATVDSTTIDPMVTCDVLTNNQIKSGQACPSGTVCSVVAFGSLIGACLPAVSSPVAAGQTCTPPGQNDPEPCEAGSMCFIDDPLHGSQDYKCVKYCKVDSSSGMDTNDPQCSSGEVCLSVSRFFTNGNALPSNNDGDTETSPSPLGFCVPQQ